MKKFILMTVLLLLTACGATEQAPAPAETAAAEPPTTVPQATAAAEQPTAAPQPTATPGATIAAPSTETAAPSATTATPATVSSEAVTIAGAEGLTLHGTLYQTAGAAAQPGVILLHMLGGQQADWVATGLVDRLAEAGYVVLTLDMRGHGATGGAMDWSLATQDLQNVWRWFSEREAVDAARTAVVGASIGANLALRTGADEPTVATAVLLSPGLDYRGVTTEDALAAYGPRPLFIVASAEDQYAADSSRTLNEMAQGETTLEMLDGAGHGTRMFAARPELVDFIVAWLDQYAAGA